MLATAADVATWRAQWTGALNKWHSPYKALVNCQNLTVTDSPEVKAALDRMIRFFQGFFLRKAAGFGLQAAAGHELLPFTVFGTEELAREDLGIRTAKVAGSVVDLRAAIQLQNHFQQHVVEVSFAEPVVLSTDADVKVLRSKLQNNLMQWHSKWSLIVDCGNLEVRPEAREEFQRLLKVMHGFFMKAAVGYGARSAEGAYPFPVYRARHRAAAELEGEGNFSGEDANCRTRR